ncbi:MAG: ABC transporter ATP-binding protein [Hyphomicrobiales bacterium]|mgnify:CR=1 FL=1|nr:MAG: ABC transporter ATP-binding protein [Hyphomicrobiales bacterium]
MREVTDMLPIVIDKVSLRRGGKTVLKEIECVFDNRHKKTLIIGPNGAGKSLLLRVAHGLLKPETGAVRWPNAPDPQAVRDGQAMVFQRPVLLRRTALDNLLFALKVRKVPKAERCERAHAALKRAGLGRLATMPARALSFGEQQRLAIARALAVRPRVLFLDEPTASLDPATTGLVEELVEEAAQIGVRIIMTSHDLNQARRLADEVLFLHRGRIKERAPAASFFEAPQNDLAAAFLKGDLLWWRRQSIYTGEDGNHENTC